MNVSETTLILQEMVQGRPEAAAQLLPLVYAELRAVAGSYFRQERADHTLEPTALVHEAFIKLVAANAGWKDRAHFMAVASSAMRQILVDHARKRITERRGGRNVRLTLTGELTPIIDDTDIDLLALHEALERLSALDPSQSQIVEMRFFGGMTAQEVAEVQGVSKTTVDNKWRIARAWLNAQLREDTGS
ncbi:MAG: ECF-type sigma factor [Planctomycetota bacterium]|nr:ECF-type sigma factor [Planctomycetota bacterium]